MSPEPSRPLKKQETSSRQSHRGQLHENDANNRPERSAHPWLSFHPLLVYPSFRTTLQSSSPEGTFLTLNSFTLADTRDRPGAGLFVNRTARPSSPSLVQGHSRLPALAKSEAAWKAVLCRRRNPTDACLTRALQDGTHLVVPGFSLAFDTVDDAVSPANLPTQTRPNVRGLGLPL